MKSILLSFIAVIIAFLPIYLWWYGVTYLLNDSWNRIRFFVGIFLWSIGVLLTYVFFLFWDKGALFEVWLFLGYFVFLCSIVLFLTYLGSRFSRIFLQKIAIVHAILLSIALGSVYFLRQWIGFFPGITPAVIVFLLTPFLEESAKHLWTLWLIGRDFHFSQKDILSFTFFVVLGFVFAENTLYLISEQFSIGTWIWRSLFSLIAHVFAALVCAYYWWKALSYPLFSLKYIVTFLTGFILAWGLHLIYNFFLQSGSIVGILLYMVFWYIVLVWKS